ncbi:MAG: TRM11 family SAM-dependent methyltransferase [Promethearchaeota archaeon]
MSLESKYSFPKEIFVFVLGRNPKLSLLEIVTYLNQLDLNFQVEEIIDSALFIKIQDKENRRKFNPFQVADKLAGTIKIGKIYLQSKEEESLDELEEELEQNNFYCEDFKKIKYAIDFYGNNIDKLFFTSFFKRIFKSMKQKAFMKNIPPHSLAISIKKGDFIDIFVCRSKKTKEYLIGRTLGVYNIKDNKKRYEKRPYIDKSIGTSVRIGRILVNLSRGGLSSVGSQNKALILDPFCGIGTIMQEALLLGITCKGLDINETRVKQCKINLKWLKNTYKISQNISYKVISGDSQTLSGIFSANEFDAIVTEPYLGPLLKTIPSPKMARKIIGDLSKLYERFFKEAEIVLKSKGKLVIIIPIFKTTANTTEKINVNFLISKTRLKIFNPYESIPADIPLNIGELKNPLVYAENWHILKRLIYILEKE